MKLFYLNTSNQGKLAEFQRLFALHGSAIEASYHDLAEIDADPIQVVAHKASQLDENVIVEDTSLDIEGASVGVNIRWLLDHLSEHVGRKAEWTVYLAFRRDNEVHIYQGKLTGTIVHSRGEKGFGFDPVFLPDGTEKTLAESKPDIFNARAQAVENLIKGNLYKKHPAIKNWNGPWQRT